MPAWDQADYLNGALHYWRMFGESDRFSPDWWQQFWVAAPKIPPLTYVFSLPFFALFGPGIQTATLVHALYSALLLSGVYGLGRQLFSDRVGLGAAALCVVLPGLYPLRLDYLLDYPVAAMVTFTFFLMTGWVRGRQWRSRLGSARRWLLAIATGLWFGLAMLTKQTALLFLLVPFLLVGLEALVRRRWGQLGQWLVAALVAWGVLRPWLTANWLLILTSSKRATVDSAVKEGDPSLLSPEAWLFYLQQIPAQMGWPILVGAIAGFFFLAIRSLLRVLADRTSSGRAATDRTSTDRAATDRPMGTPWPKKDHLLAGSLPWLVAFLLGAYLLNSLNPNKDARYIAPYLPVLSLFLAYGLSLWPRRLSWLPKGAIVLSCLALILNLFPIGGSLARTVAQTLSPSASGAGQHLAQTGFKPGRGWPHPEIIGKITELEPNFQTTIGVLPSTPGLNQHNVSLFGNLADFRVAGRQVGTQAAEIGRDVRSLSWFLTKTGDQGSVPAAQAQMVKAVETSPEFAAVGQWPLPDDSDVTLWQRRQPQFSLEAAPANTGPELRLLSVNLPAKAPPGQPLPVTYRWSGSLETLQNTVLALTWQKQLTRGWVHDHAPALGTLRRDFASDSRPLPSDIVILTERLAMLPDVLPDGAQGEYRLTATALDRTTGQAQILDIPATTLTLEAKAPAQPAPELDWLSQLRNWAKRLPAGPQDFAPSFEDIGRVNQYVPDQDYLNQAEIALRYRLTQAFDPAQKLEDAYALALTQVLQQKRLGAIAAFQSLTQLDPQNPYAHAYLAFVQLYGFQPRAAARSLEPAKHLAPDQPEIQILDAVAGLMSGNLFKAWEIFQRLKA